MVLGATGFIGPALAASLESLGHEPVCVSRRGEAGVAADRSDAPAIGRLAREVGADAVVDLLAMVAATTEPLLDALAGHVGRYVLVSSGDVYGQYGALHRLEDTGSPLATLHEEAPLRRRLYPYRTEPRRPAGDPDAWLDDYDKVPIEDAVRARPELAGVIVRLPMVYGPRDRQRRFAWAIGPMAAGRPVVEIDARWAAWRTTYGYVEDVALGLALAATHPAAAGRTYNVGAQDTADHATWAARFADALGWTGELRSTHAPSLDTLDLDVPFLMDTGRIRRELGYAEPTGPRDAIRCTIEDEINRAA